MAEVKVAQSHQLGADEARARVTAFEELLSKYGIKPQWSGHKAKIKALGVSGSIDVTDSRVDVALKLGMMAKAAGIDPARLEASIRKRLEAALSGE